MIGWFIKLSVSVLMDVCRIYVDIIFTVIYWSVRSSSGKGGDGEVVILARYKFNFIRVLDNLVIIYPFVFQYKSILKLKLNENCYV